MKDIFGLYVILTNPVTGYEKCAEAAIKAGVKYIQLRMKHMTPGEILPVAKTIRRITSGTKSLFIVNDDVRIAAEVDADGVHLGQDDMHINEARAFWEEPGKIYGLSTHNEQQAEAAIQLKPDYIGVGPVFSTPTKEKPDPVLGTKKMGKIITSSSITTVAIGGINLSNLYGVLKSGALNFSVVRPIMESEYPYKTILQFMDVRKTYIDKAHL